MTIIGSIIGAFCILFVLALFVTLFKSCKKEDKIPEHINQLEELENFEYKDYFSSLCEFGYKTEVTKKSECFIPTQDNYVIDLMSETGVTYTTKDILTDDSYGLAFRLHFKGGCKIKSIEFDFKTLNAYKYVFPSASNYSCLSKEQNYLETKAIAMNYHRDAFKWEKESHFVFNFDEKNNFKCKDALTDSVIFKFCQTGSLLTSYNYGVVISNLRINLNTENVI